MISLFAHLKTRCLEIARLTMEGITEIVLLAIWIDIRELVLSGFPIHSITTGQVFEWSNT